MLDSKFFRKVGPKVVAKFRKHTFIKALDIDGKKFKPYSTRPSKWVTMSMKAEARKGLPKEGISYAAAKKTGQLKRSVPESKKNTAPILSSDLLRDWKMVSNIGTLDVGFRFGTISHGGKVAHLAKMGRVIAREGKALPDKISEYLMKEAEKYVQKKLDKIKGGKVDIEIRQ